MDTNSNIPLQRKVVDVEILYLSETGYGPRGQYTRRQWRKRCCFYLHRGKDRFESWQESWKNQIVNDLPKVNFGVVTCFSDGSKLYDLTQPFDGKSPYTLDFSGHTFQDFLDCACYTFQQTALFNSSIFSGASAFNLATFNGGAVFRCATFNGFTHFSATFNKSADFYSSTFSGFAAFDNATFSEGVSFNEAKFNGGAGFSGTTFSGNAYFFLALFGEYASFGGAIFRKDANFSQATFCRQCRFHNSFDEKNRIWSQETVFEGLADFDSAVFKM